MSRIPTPETISAAPAASQPLLIAVEKMLGSTPNMVRLIGNSPVTLEGYLGLNSALGKGRISAATRERITLDIANFNGCDYCNSAHTYLGKALAKLDDAEIAANRTGRSTDAKADAAVRFAVSVAEARGRVTAQDVAAVRNAGYSDAEVVEIVGHVALNVLTNYINEVFETEIDFPVFEAGRAA
ncbi:carboxymuconolactone decarboxylase family protein [Roseobacter sinensis]|uniref:Carboxymuconolactone decarboxylase family protein n=1 Tax=Roseobacter sinensis TaxID=2931391 RepID=A0ABT3BE30_9RHOB|nr:carboxymuconolactone decarboxylase family protein [Roseobacter sp. WL0113]MCV3271836.1 carboxymuconolactone decarboxylase family protein [Roseobacter sp. WL0113]